ncbi:MAG TPA: phosphomannomutase/phosphoglucomutase, partial [Candidatus Aminicenantes bacterium]|nr:phosphomannomutase/phosphoglucomutase [Candidatus Aminicenantes bacterium]
MTTLEPTIFREYDIRGIADTELTDPAVTQIAAAIATVFVREGKKKIALGRDGRPSSPRIAAVACQVLAQYGLTILDLGMVPTPLTYFATFHLDLDGAVMITASHNPGEYNGVKIMVGKAPLFGEGLQELYRIAAAGQFPPEIPGRVEPTSLLDEYMDYVAAGVKLDRKIKVVVDAGNGTGGLTAGPLYRRLGAEVTELFCDVDGSFPNHHPDPTKLENLKALTAKVAETGADLGIGLDGDADRIGVIDNRGRVLWGDQLLVLFSRDILQRHPGAKVISEVKASEVLYSDVAKHGGVPIMWKTGHSLIKKKIREENALIAGEMSGHMFFNDKWPGFDDAVYAGARLLELLSAQSRSLADLRDTIPSAVNTPEIRVDTKDDQTKFAIVAEIQRHFRQTRQVIDIDLTAPFIVATSLGIGECSPNCS